MLGAMSSDKALLARIDRVISSAMTRLAEEAFMETPLTLEPVRVSIERQRLPRSARGRVRGARLMTRRSDEE